MLPKWYWKYRDFIEKSINRELDKYFKNKKIDTTWLKRFQEIAYYSTSWWKKLRAILSLEFFLILSWKKLKEIKKSDDIIKFCVAIELMHAYSLVHDDLPCMDNDELRRWQLTVWKKYSEYEAVLAWDLLWTMCYELLSEIKDKKIWLELVKIISKSTWFFWMVWWQVEDMYFEKNSENLTLENLISLEKKKTWAFIKASIIWWILLSWRTKKLNKLKDFWEKIWLAFQIKDDLLDVEWNQEETGKSVWWEKKWFVYFEWIEKTRKKLNILLQESLEIIKDLKSEKLNFLVNYIWERKK